MIKVGKPLSLLVAVFLVLSNLAFAQSSLGSSGSGSSSSENVAEQVSCIFEGSFSIEKCYSDDGRFGCEGKGTCSIKVLGLNGEKLTWKSSCGGYQYSITNGDDETIRFSCVNEKKLDNAKEKEMMGRFNRGEVTEEDMRVMAQAKMGDKFSEMEFQKIMLESKERMNRKDAFSYNHEGFEAHFDFGPSYEGYSSEQMIYGRVFGIIGDDIDPREIKQYCDHPSEFADLVISKFKERVGGLQDICSQFDENEAKCREMMEIECSQIGTPRLNKDSTELEKIQSIAYSCPLNKDAIIQACKLRDKYKIQQRISAIAKSCEERFNHEGDRLMKECERFKQATICGKDKYINQCMGGIKKENFDQSQRTVSQIVKAFKYAKWECYDGHTESQGSETTCRPSENWNGLARKSCEGHCYPDKSKCGLNSISVSGECGASSPNNLVSSGTLCPTQQIPQCKEGYRVQKRVDGNGCASYYCELYEIECPADVQQCSDGRFVKRIPPKCDFELCQLPQCPYREIPKCSENSNLQKKIDANGCVYYYCENIVINCPKPACEGAVDSGKRDVNNCIIYTCSDGSTAICKEVARPTCNTGETLNSYYDNVGCVTSYQCTNQLPQCPQISKPACAEGQSVTTKYDDKGCVSAYVCVTIAPSTTGSAIKITGNVIGALGTYDDFLRQCEKSWLEQQRLCLNTPNVCEKDTFIEKCNEYEQKNAEDSTAKIEQNCEINTGSEIKYAEERCARIDNDRQRCIEQSIKRCEQIKGLAEKCIEVMTEDKLRNFIIEEVKKRCKFTGIIQDQGDVRNAEKAEIVLAVLNTATASDFENLRLFVDNLKEDLKLQDTTVYRGTIDPNRFGDIKLLPFVVNAKISAPASSDESKLVKEKIVAGLKAEQVASKLVSLRDSNVPSEYIYIIEDKASEVLNVSGQLGELEKKDSEKGFGYKIKLFFGLAKKAEREEINQLEESKSKLQNSIDTLAKLFDEVPNDVAKSILKEQVENLKKQQEDIDSLIKSKEKKAKGLFGIFG